MHCAQITSGPGAPFKGSAPPIPGSKLSGGEPGCLGAKSARFPLRWRIGRWGRTRRSRKEGQKEGREHGQSEQARAEPSQIATPRNSKNSIRREFGVADSESEEISDDRPEESARTANLL